MTQSKNQAIYLDTNNTHGYTMSKFLPTSGFKYTDPQEFDLNKYTRSSSKVCVLKVNLEYQKELRELHNDYHLTPDKKEIKREILSDYQLNISDFTILRSLILKNSA